MIGRHCVVEVATALCDDAIPGAGRVGAIASPALREVIAASVLRFELVPGGGARRVGLVRLDAVGTPEPELLARLDVVLRRLHDRGHALVAFRPEALQATLARRASRFWLFSAFDLPSWSGPVARVVDLAAGWGSDVTLAEACAAIGLQGAGELASPPSTAPEAAAKRCDLAVAAGAMLLLHGASRLERSPLPLVRGWCDLAAFIRSRRDRLAHLAGLRTTGVVDEDAVAALGGSAPRAASAQGFRE